MRNILGLLVVVLAFAASSCKKCQTCTTETTQIIGGVTQVLTSTSQEYCGDDYDSAPTPVSVTQDVGGVQQTVTISCHDN